MIRALKIIGWIVLSIVALLLVLALAIQIPYVQHKLTDKAVSFLKNKIGTEVRLAHISLSFPKRIVLEGLYVEDQAKDTLLYAGELSVNTDLWALTQNEINLSGVSLENATGHIKRAAQDSAFNFTFIVDAFAGDSTAVPDTTQSTPWTFTVGQLALKQIQFSYHDKLTGNDVDLDLGMLDVDLDEFDLNGPTVKINSIDLQHVQARMEQTKSAPPSTPTVAAVAPPEHPFVITIEEVTLKDIAADYNHTVLGQRLHLNLGELQVAIDAMDLNTQHIAVDEFSLSDTFIAYHQAATEASAKKPSQPEQTDSTASAPWDVSVKSLSLANNNVQYHDFRKPLQPQGMDFAHLWVTRLNGEAEDLRYADNTFGGDIKNISFQEKSGFGVTALKTNFSLTDKALEVKDFYFQSPESIVSLKASAQFASLASLGQTYPEATVNLNLRNATLAVRDVLYFYPALADSLPLDIPPNTTVTISAVAQGKVKDLSIEKLALNTLSKTSLKASGTVVGLPDMDKVEMRLTLQEFYTTAVDIQTVVPKRMLPSSIAIPEWLKLTGKMNGSLQTPHVDALLATAFGNVAVNARMDLDSQKKRERYDGKVLVKDFALGKLLKQNAMGKLNMTASAKGSGLSMETLNTSVDVRIADFAYGGYTYRDFIVNGSLKKYFFSGNAKLNDKNLSFNLKGDFDYTDKVPEYNIVFALENADFQALRLSERPLRARGTLDVKLATSDFKVLNGNLDIRKVAIFNGTSLYRVDSLLFASIDQRGESEISIRSDILSGDFKGTINLYSLPEVLTHHFNRYFSLQDTLYTKRPTVPQNFKFSLVLKNTDLLTEIIFPELDPFVPGEISGEFDSEKYKLDLRVNFAKVKYSAVSVDSVSFLATSNAKSFDYGLRVRDLRVDSLHISAVSLSGKVASDSIRTKFTLLDSLQKEKYVFGGAFYSLKKTFQFHLLPSEVVLNYWPWEAPADNALRFTRKGLVAHNFSLTNINEKISLITKSATDSTLSVVFKDLNLPNITSLVEGITPAEGLMNGDFKLAGQGAFKSTLTIQELKIFGQLWGDLALNVARTAKPYLVDVRVTGKEAKLAVNGTYTPDEDAPDINLKTTIDITNLAIVEPLSGKQLKNASGRMNGDIAITGNPSSPSIRGELHFEEAAFVPAFVNSKFVLKDERLSFTEDGIELRNFRILDENNNTASLQGMIKTKSYSDFDLDLNLNASDFQLINTTEDDNDLFFGKVGIDLRARITGNLNVPNVRADVSITDGSSFTYIVPQSEKGVLEQKGIVVFVDRDAENDPFLKAINPKDTVKSRFKGIELTANIELSDKEDLNIVIDPIAGDKLTVKGNSTLTLDIDPTGNMQLTGQYEISEGSYNLSFYKLVKRDFKIEKGSSITWQGDPLTPLMDIRAIYAVETSPAELGTPSSAQGGSVDPRQRMPFLVYLIIKGNMMTPEISFLLDMPEGKRDPAVYAQIKDINTRESDLNKQVFALLILKRFIADNPFASQGGGSDVSSTARNSVGKLLTEQLNRLTENIKGVQLTFDVKSYEDYSSGRAEGQTEVQLGVSKSLLNNRLIVKVSGNVDVEGETSSQSSFADYIGDLALEYKITEDGRLRITGFRNSNYDMIDGELTETGAGLIYIKDYDTLRELFKANNAKEK
ncbi:translocation/assembly module TamB domain-containing protein [Chryseolinea lacunae]|uniref:Translocation/assembly module TamB domain-containing protein n=1 Tax=Chryseolinea lacunae TaxID=2801331 RepID=A0ABS1L3I2_9BACT|nr:translocation/assembly module TamB domain-containing protein [Chryseolinea lacunae]MBL0745116.1 translocation/assembly module TamB domain-containing protein [Chryseolinea lacunae]